MKKYKVNVNGTVYEVAIEVMDGAAPAPAPAAAFPTPDRSPPWSVLPFCIVVLLHVYALWDGFIPADFPPAAEVSPRH